MTSTTTILTLLVGVATLGDVFTHPQTDQSDAPTPNEHPIEILEGKRRLETPEVVLQLKYESGELNRIYLAQFRKDKESWVPSVPTRNNLCADLCHAGLGGEACGPSCPDMLPVGLQNMLTSSNDTNALYGQPRVDVCPTLCHYHLGQPLCKCEEFKVEADSSVHWSEVCKAFCLTDGYMLNGCPPCEETSTIMPITMSFSRVLDTAVGWRAWCNVQCHGGHGGAACNCDRSFLQ